MNDIEQQARELLAAECEKAGFTESADRVRSEDFTGEAGVGYEISIRAIVSALASQPRPAVQGVDLEEESDCQWPAGGAEFEKRQEFPTSPVGSWEWLRGVIGAIPVRRETIGGEAISYIHRDDVMAWLDEGQRRAEQSFIASQHQQQESGNG